MLNTRKVATEPQILDRDAIDNFDSGIQDTKETADVENLNEDLFDAQNDRRRLFLTLLSHLPMSDTAAPVSQMVQSLKNFMLIINRWKLICGKLSQILKTWTMVCNIWLSFFLRKNPLIPT